MIATAMAAATMAMQQCDANATAMVMDGNGWCNGNTIIGKRLGERILVKLFLINKKKCQITLILLFCQLVDLTDLCIYPKTTKELDCLFKSTH